MSVILTPAHHLDLLTALEAIDVHRIEIDRLDSINGLDHAEREIIFSEILHRKTQIDRLHEKLAGIMR